MKTPAVVSLILLLWICPANAQTKSARATPNAKVEQELRKLERQWLDAYLNKDVAAMERILAEDFTITYGDGTVRDKAETIRGLKLGVKNSDEYHWTEDSKVRVYGDTAIITGKFLYRRHPNDKQIGAGSRYTDTYIKRNGRWQVAASHLSNIAKQ